MGHDWGNQLIKQLKSDSFSFGEKLCLVEKLLPLADEILGTQLAKVLIESAMEVKPSKKELYYLCEASEGGALLGRYLRAFFCGSGNRPELVEMARRLEQVLSFRLINPHPGQDQYNDVKLHDTVVEYLSRNRAA